MSLAVKEGFQNLYKFLPDNENASPLLCIVELGIGCSTEKIHVIYQNTKAILVMYKEQCIIGVTEKFDVDD